MGNWLHKLYIHRYFLLFIMLFGYVESIYMRVAAKNEINAYMFTPEAVFFVLLQAGVLYLIILFFISRWQRSEEFSVKESIKIFAASLLLFPMVMQSIGLLISLLLGNVDRNFNRETFFHTTFTFFLHGITYGSFFLAYYYFQRSRKHKQQLAVYNQALAESRINHLKAQMNPHFLFNNLNVLDQLIEEDKHKASDFLNEFSEVYRYVLQASDQKVISLEEELQFAQQYFKLIQHKYGSAYQLDIKKNVSKGGIVPMTLQLLIENACQHNLGTTEQPVFITVEIDEHICVSNNIHLKRTAKGTNGRALLNLKEQYRILTNKPIQIKQTETLFSVTIPIIDTES